MQKAEQAKRLRGGTRGRRPSRPSSQDSGPSQERPVKRQDVSLMSVAEKLNEMKTERSVHQVWGWEGH